MSGKLTRRQFLQISGTGALAASVGLWSCGAEPPAKPNIIYIMADDLGYGDLGCYGQEQIQTPNLDRMANQGIRFTDHYAGSTVCAPSRSVLMTGKHTGHTYIRGNQEVKPYGQEPLRGEIRTVAEMLKDAGYSTGCIGKWGLGPPETEGAPENQGFDYFFGYLGQRHAHNYYPEYLFRNNERVPLDNVVENDRLDGAGHATKKVQYAHDLIAEEAMSFVQSHKTEPFYLYFSPTIPHANNEAGDEGMEIPDYGQYTDKDWPEPQKGLAAMISRLDRDVGELLDMIQQMNLDRNTIVLFTSDNGPHAEGGNDPYFFDSNGPLRGIKRDLYEGGIRVPMIAWWPGQISPGSETDHPSAFWDFLPTAADLAGIADIPENDGISYLPAMLGQDQPEHEYLYWEFPARGGKQAVRMGDWKGVRLEVRELGRQAPMELYNLAEDIGEENNVASDHPDIVEQIAQIMDEAHSESLLFPLYPDE
jgi:arylsulfatase A-like enzyme